MNLPPVVFADGNWIGIVITLVVILVSLANQFLGGEKGKPGPTARQQPPPTRRPPKAKPIPQRQAVDSEVEEFVRRAAERRGREAPRREAPRREVEVIRAEPPKPPKPRRERRVQATGAEAADKAASGEPQRQVKRLQPQIETHVDTSDITARAGHLGGLDLRKDESIQAHVHDVFDHQLGNLQSSSAAAASQKAADASAQAAAEGSPEIAGAPVRAAAAGLAVLFADPENLRQAIVLNEVLRRPVDRW